MVASPFSCLDWASYYPMNWMKGRSTGNPHVFWSYSWFLIDIPLNQIVEISQQTRFAPSKLKRKNALLACCNTPLSGPIFWGHKGSMKRSQLQYRAVPDSGQTLPTIDALKPWSKNFQNECNQTILKTQGKSIDMDMVDTVDMQHDMHRKIFGMLPGARPARESRQKGSADGRNRMY